MAPLLNLSRHSKLHELVHPLDETRRLEPRNPTLAHPPATQPFHGKRPSTPPKAVPPVAFTALQDLAVSYTPTPIPPSGWKQAVTPKAPRARAQCIPTLNSMAMGAPPGPRLLHFHAGREDFTVSALGWP